MEVGQSIPDGWEVVSSPKTAPAASVPDGWEVVSTAPTKEKQSDSGALGIRAAAAAVPVVARGAAEFATNPNVAKTGAAIGKVIGGVAPVVGGLVEGGPVGGLVGVAAASRGAWAGSKTGWFTGKMLQSLSAPIANAAETLAPYAQAISTVSGAQGVLDLAQMADSARKDIGTLGVSIAEPRSQAEKDAHPALLNAVAAKIGELATSLKNVGVPAAEATALKLISDGNAATFGKLMTIYMKAKNGR